METALKLPLRHRLPSLTNTRSRSTLKFANNAHSSMPLLRPLISSNTIVTRHRLNLFCIAPKAMADEKVIVNGQGKELSKADGNKKIEEIGKSPPPVDIPPPPEKPLPDDCCGSGCVRCVWDVYYDELEEYNKLYQK